MLHRHAILYNEIDEMMGAVTDTIILYLLMAWRAATRRERMTIEKSMASMATAMAMAMATATAA